MLLGYWHERLLRYAPEGEGEGEGGGNNGNDGGGGDGKKANDNDPAWVKDRKWATDFKEEFGEDFDPEKTRQLIRNLRKSETTLKGQVKELGGKAAESDAAKTELQKLQERIDTLDTENKAHKERQHRDSVRTSIATAGRNAGAHEPDELWRQLDDDDLDVDADGKVKNATALVSALKREKGYLFGRVTVDSGIRTNNGLPADADMNQRIRASAGRS